MEILKFSTCPRTSNWPLCTCPKKILLVRKNRLRIAYTFLCFNNLLFQKQHETRYQLSCKQYRSRSAGFFRSQLIRIYSVFNATWELIIINQNMKYRIILILYICTCPPVFGVSLIARLKPSCSATETS